MTSAAALAKAIRASLARGLKHERAAARAQRAILLQTRRELLRDIAGRDAGTTRVAFQLQALASIDAAIARGRQQATQAIGQATGVALQIGQDRVTATLGQLGVDAAIGAVHDTSSALLAAVNDVTTDQIRGVWSELGTRLKATVRRAALGTVLPMEAQQAITTAIRDPKVFGTAAHRAEAIVRTELNRTYSLAADRRLQEANARLGGRLRKVWIVSVDARTRESHVEAGRRYAPGGNPGPIPIDEAFEVGDARLMMPQDPSGPASEVIQCRCTMAPFIDRSEGR